MEGEVEVDVIFLRFVKNLYIDLHCFYNLFTLNSLLLSAKAFVLHFS